MNLEKLALTLVAMVIISGAILNQLPFLSPAWWRFFPIWIVCIVLAIIVGRKLEV
jgi:hypothetical protein